MQNKAKYFNNRFIEGHFKKMDSNVYFSSADRDISYMERLCPKMLWKRNNFYLTR